MTDSERERRRLRSVLAWEARWIPLEMVWTALGLTLGMGYDCWNAATVCLFTLCIVSGVVRSRHYADAA